jgi:hypothetical protein
MKKKRKKKKRKKKKKKEKKRREINAIKVETKARDASVNGAQ